MNSEMGERTLEQRRRRHVPGRTQYMDKGRETAVVRKRPTHVDYGRGVFSSFFPPQPFSEIIE